MKTHKEIWDKRDQLEKQINPLQPLSATTMMNTVAIQALEWVLDKRENIVGES